MKLKQAALFLESLFLDFNKTGALTTEIIAVLCILALAFLAPRLGAGFFRQLEARIRPLASRQWTSVLIIAILAFCTSAVRSFLTQMPQPEAHDEFSYLLAADTFAHGRLTNPPHPLSIHFETFHTIQKPTYASKYPPAQGMFLAIGQLVTGHPIAGVWFSIACACAAICWMLRAYVSPGWAFAGGFIVMVRLVMVAQSPPIIAGYWSQSYWGGAVAAFGGALIFGALRRIFDRPCFSQAVVLGFGLAVLMNSRPYEGFIASLPVTALLIAQVFRRKGDSKREWVVCAVLPVGAMIIITALWMGYYNFRVTGNWARLPYQVYEEQYSVAPVLLLQHPRPAPEYHHKVMRDYSLKWAMDIYTSRRPVKSILTNGTVIVFAMWNFFVQIVLSLPLLALWQSWRDRWIRFALLVCILFTAGLLLETWNSPHYEAPITCLLFLIVIHAMSRMRAWKIGKRRFGLSVARGIVAVYFIFWLAPFGRTLSPPRDSWNLRRAQIEADLKVKQGKHLVIVRYTPEHSAHCEWVYNGADIEGAKIVWARDMGNVANTDLLKHFKDYRIWLLQPDLDLQLVPYTSVAQIPLKQY